jgi:hypothetical protein
MSLRDSKGRMKMSISDKIDELYQHQEVIKQLEVKRTEIKQEALQMVIDQYYKKLINKKDQMSDNDLLTLIEHVAKRSYDIGSK